MKKLTAVASPGYYAGKGEWDAFFVFIGMLIFSVILVVVNGKRTNH